MTDLRDGINSLADEARSAAEKIADQAHDEGKVIAIEFHQIARKAGAKVKDAEETTEIILKLVDRGKL
jgi:hypothetical protein